MTTMWRKPYHIVIEAENKQCRILKQFAALGLKHLKVVDIRGSNNAAVQHLLELDREQAAKIPQNFKRTAPRHKAEGKPSMWLESEGCEVCSAILTHGAFLISGKSIEEHTIMYSFMAPTFEAYTNIIRALENAGHKVNVLKVGKFEPKKEILTEKQEQVFWIALKSGFFDYPRKIGVRELSAKLGIKPSTLSEIVRRGTRRLLEHHFEKKST